MREVLKLGMIEFPFPVGLREALGRGIRKRRLDLFLTQANVASAAKLTVGYLSQIENGLRIPSVKLLCRIASELKISVSKLFTYDQLDGKQDPYLRALIKAIRILEKIKPESVHEESAG